MTGQITLTSALPTITSNLTIQGPGAGVLAVSGIISIRCSTSGAGLRTLSPG